MGSDVLVTPGDEAIQCRHNAINFGFRFHWIEASKSAVIQMENYNNGKLGKDDLGSYVLPGPFATWRVSVSKVWNTNLSLKGISDARFEFSGYRREFAMGG